MFELQGVANFAFRYAECAPIPQIDQLCDQTYAAPSSRARSASTASLRREFSMQDVALTEELDQVFYLDVLVCL